MTPLRRLGPRALVVGLLGVLVLLAGIAYAAWGVAAEGDDVSPSRRAALSGAMSSVEGELVPGGAVTGSLVVRNGSPRPVHVRSAHFAAARTAARGCTTEVVFALTVEPSAATPLVLPPDSPATPFGWTAFLPEDAEDTCQGARFTSTLVLGGEPVGTATATAATLAAPGQPVGAPTGSTAVAVRWPAAPAATSYSLERAPAGTADWGPACGTAGTPLSAPSCTDTGLEPGTAYAYRAVAVRGAWRTVGRLSTDVLTPRD